MNQINKHCNQEKSNLTRYYENKSFENAHLQHCNIVEVLQSHQLPYKWHICNVLNVGKYYRMFDGGVCLHIP